MGVGGSRSRPVSGRQFLLHGHGYVAEVASVGASLRSLRHGGRDLVLVFAADEVRPAMSGAVLAPWPNRVGDGRYTFGAVDHQLPLTEVELGNASHGLVAWLDFTGTQSDPDRVRLETVIEAQPGYPWRVGLQVEYALERSGLSQRTSVTNLGACPAPFGLGGHPYLVGGPAGRGAVDSWFLQVPAEHLLESDHRRLPVREVHVAEFDGGEFDFRRRRAVGATVIDRSYTKLQAGPDGWARVQVTDEAGHGSELRLDARCPWVHLYTADLAVGDRWRSAVAVEPMTCPPDALRSGRDVLVLDPGTTTTVEWAICPVVPGGEERQIRR